MTPLDPRIPSRLRRWPGLHGVGGGSADVPSALPGWHGLRASFITSEERTWVGPWIETDEQPGVLGPLRAWSIPGPLPADAVGVLVEVLEPLRRVDVSILAYSTHGTDWVLVAASQAEVAEAAWSAAGWTIEDAEPDRPRTT